MVRNSIISNWYSIAFLCFYHILIDFPKTGGHRCQYRCAQSFLGVGLYGLQTLVDLLPCPINVSGVIKNDGDGDNPKAGKLLDLNKRPGRLLLTCSMGESDQPLNVGGAKRGTEVITSTWLLVMSGTASMGSWVRNTTQRPTEGQREHANNQFVPDGKGYNAIKHNVNGKKVVNGLIHYRTCQVAAAVIRM